jgi:hypothetical protein
MTDSIRDADRDLDALVCAAASRRRGGLIHPEPDELVAYCKGFLSSAEEERIQEHLALCRDCAQLVLDLRAALAPAPADGESATPALERQWDRLQDRLGRGRPRLVAAGNPSIRMAWLLAASLLVGVGLVAWDLSLRRSLERALQPQANLQLVDLAPLNQGVRRSPEHPVEVAMAPEVAKVVLLLDLGDLRRFPRYTVALADPTDRVAWRAPARRGEDGTFLLEMPAQSLATPGLYRILLDGLSDGVPTRLADYAFVVVR